MGQGITSELMNPALNPPKNLMEENTAQAVQEPKPLEKPGWRPFDRQIRFLSCPVFECHYGGAAGGGKSDALLVAALEHCRTPGAKVLLLRRKFVDLERSLMQKAFVLFAGRGRWDGQHKRWTMNNKTSIEFGHCQTGKDLENYYSAEYSMIGIDQVEQFPEDMYLFFFTRTRTTSPKVKCQIRITSNPVGIGRGWLAKRFWILGKDAKPSNKAYPVTDDIVFPDGHKETLTYYRAFIPSKVWDNPHIIKNDPQYILRLQMQSPEKRKALLDGRWDAFEGAFFTEFDEKIHVCEPFEIPQNWKRSISFDWGYSDPMACYWWAEDPRSGKLYCYREFFTKKMLDIDVAKNIARMSYGESIDCIYYPWDLDFARGQVGASMRERMDEEWKSMGLNFYLKVATKDRLNGWSACRYMLALGEDKTPRMQIFSNCKNLIETIPEQIHDDGNPEDLDTLGNDHCVDGWRYFAASYRKFFEKSAIALETDYKRLPIDVGAATKMPDGSFQLKREPILSFRWMAE